MKVPLLVVVFLILGGAGCGSPEPTAVSEQDWGPTSRGLRLGMSPAISDNQPFGGPEFSVVFQNAGGSEFALNLGYTLANGQRRIPAAIRLMLTDPAGQTRELHISGSPVAGRVDDFIVGLHAGSTYALRLKLQEYWSPTTRESRVRLIRGEHRVRARFSGEARRYPSFEPQPPESATVNFWTGTLESNVVEFSVSQIPPG